MNQTKLGSLCEACVNIVIGFTINFVANSVILPHIGCQISPGTNFYIGFLYTFISLVRQYIIRRWFNAGLHEAAQQMAGAIMLAFSKKR